MSQNIISKYAVRDGETVSKVEYENGFYSRYFELNDFQKAILKATNDLLMVNFEILCKYFDYCGMKYSKYNLEKEMKFLGQSECLEGWQVTAETSPEADILFYILGRKAPSILRKMSVRLRLNGYVHNSIKSPIYIKKILSSNYAMLSIATEDSQIQNAKMFIARNEQSKKKETKRLFRANAYVHDEVRNSATIIESVRGERESSEFLIDKLRRMEKTIKARENCNVKLPQDIMVLLVMENLEMKNEYTKLLKKYKFKGFRIALTYDELLELDDLEVDSKVEFVVPMSWWERLFAA